MTELLSLRIPKLLLVIQIPNYYTLLHTLDNFSNHTEQRVVHFFCFKPQSKLITNTGCKRNKAYVLKASLNKPTMVAADGAV